VRPIESSKGLGRRVGVGVWVAVDVGKGVGVSIGSGVVVGTGVRVLVGVAGGLVDSTIAAGVLLAGGVAGSWPWKLQAASRWIEIAKRKMRLITLALK
jgi:hypothetical protein